MVYEDRVVVLVDMDCFYCQVEENLNPRLLGKPIAVVQYNAWRGGGIIAVNYPARDRGVTRHMRGAEAKKICPEINLVTVPNVRGKADLTKYREAGKKVADVLQTFTPLLERASVDEAYLDITAAVENRIDNMVCNLKPENFTNTFVVGSNIENFLHNIYSDVSMNNKNLKLAVGAFITEQIRAAVYKKTGYRCSAGIAHNKILAKLVCGLNKPNKQTILSEEGLHELYKDLPLKKIKSLGGKFGLTVTEKLGIKTMGELSKFTENKLQQHFDDKTANWLYNIAKGIDNEPVTKRLISKSIGCCKKFPGKTALKTGDDIIHWLSELAEEVCERLEKDCQENNRRAKQMIVNFVQQIKDKDVSGSRTVALTSYDKNKIVSLAFDAIKRNCQLPSGGFHLKLLGISACNFENVKNVREITSFFKNVSNTTSSSFLTSNLNGENFMGNYSTSEPMCVSETVETNNIENNLHFRSNESESAETSNIEDNLQFRSGENENVDSDDSVYSASTEELNQNIEEFKFYPEEHRLKSEDLLILSNEIKSKCNTNEKIFKENKDSCGITADGIHTENILNNDTLGTEYVSADEENSIENEFSISKGNDQPAGSFFRTWFDAKNDNVKSPVDRSFDTSIILKEISDDESDDKENNIDAVPYENNDSNESNILPFTAYNDDTEVCTECNKSILKIELQSHMDYHYALKLVKEESKLQVNQNAESRISNKGKELSKSTKNGKRKRSIKETDKKFTITKFFMNDATQNETFVDGLHEICTECKKNVRIDELPSHMDYHAAKKLHLEINSIKSSPQQNTKTENKNKKVKKDTKLKSVTSYFTPKL